MTEKAPIPPEPSSDQARSTYRTKLGIGIVLVFVVGIAGLMLYAQTQTRTVTLALNGTAQSLQTRALTVNALLNEQNIFLNPADQVSPAVESALYDGQLITVTRAHRVYIQVEDVATISDVVGDTAAEILENMGQELQTNARIFVNDEEVDASRLNENTGEIVSRIVIFYPRPFSVIVEPALGDGNAEHFFPSSSAITVGEALFETGFEIYLADDVTPELSTPLYTGLEIHIRRAQPVDITVDGTTLTTRVLEGTVADALTAAGVALIAQDYSIPDLNTLISPDTTIRVVRVKESLITEIQPIPYETLYQEDAGLMAGTEQIIQEGRDGTEQVVTRIRIEDGEETARTVIGRTLLAAPQPQIIARAP